MRKELIISIVLIMIGVSLTFGCTGNKTTTPTDSPTATLTATPEATYTATPATTPMNVEVTINNLTFDPANVSISVGDTVVWKNVDKVEHQIKIAEAESTILTEGKIFSHTFNTAGTFNYTCTIHPSMKGTVIVK